MSNFFWRLCTAATVTAATAVLVSDFAIPPEGAAAEAEGESRSRTRRRIARQTEPVPASGEDEGRTAGRTRRNVSH